MRRQKRTPLPPTPCVPGGIIFFFNRSRTSLIAARPKEPVHRWLLDYIPVYSARTGSPEGRQGDLSRILSRQHLSRLLFLLAVKVNFSRRVRSADVKMYGDEYNNNIMDLIILYMYKYMRIYLLCELLHKPAIKKNEKIIRFLLLVGSVLLYMLSLILKKDIIELFFWKVYFARGNPPIYFMEFREEILNDCCTIHRDKMVDDRPTF